jgi:putative Ca2+/H+ antiporter (TMEM165/GDT1 family)
MNLAVLATVFGVIFVAELPDKTALASLVLGTKHRAAHVFVGVAAAFTVHVVLAIMTGWASCHTARWTPPSRCCLPSARY